MKLKFCGIRRPEDVAYVNEVKPDFAGFIFANTRRKITLEQAVEFRFHILPEIPVVGVFVNENPETIIHYVKGNAIDMVQLHGDETNDEILQIKEATGVEVIKAVRAKDVESIRKADAMECDYLLIDAYQPGVYGGTGNAFDWTMIPKDLHHPFFLAGGLNASNVRQAMQQVPAYALDISCGIETEGCKDLGKMKEIKKIGDESNVEI